MFVLSDITSALPIKHALHALTPNVQDVNLQILLFVLPVNLECTYQLLLPQHLALLARLDALLALILKLA